MTSINLDLIQSIEREARILNHLADKLEGIVNDPEFKAGCTIMSVTPEDATDFTQGLSVRAKAFRLYIALPLVSRLRNYAKGMVGAIHAPHEGDHHEWLMHTHGVLMDLLDAFMVTVNKDLFQALRNGRSILKEIQEGQEEA